MLSCGNTYAYKPDSSLEARIKSCVVKIIRYNRSGDPVGTGTGFFVAPTKVITNRHVVAGGYSAAIQSLEREVFPVQGVAAYDELLDLVLLEVDVPLRKFDYLDTGTIIPFKGDRVIVIGNPWGRGPKTTTGVVTDIQEWEFVGKVIEYDAPTFPGNSGSPVFTTGGRVIGVATWGRRYGGKNIGYAIPCERILNLSWGTVETLEEWSRRLKKKIIAKNLFQKGYNLFKNGSYKSAVPCFEKAVENNPEFAEAWFLLGMCRYKSGYFDQAISAYKRAIRYRNDFFQAYFHLAVAYEGTGRSTEAEDYYNRVISIKEDHVDAHFKLGMLYIDMGKRKDAEAKYRDLLDYDILKAKTLREHIEREFKK